MAVALDRRTGIRDAIPEQQVGPDGLDVKTLADLAIAAFEKQLKYPTRTVPVSSQGDRRGACLATEGNETVTVSVYSSTEEHLGRVTCITNGTVGIAEHTLPDGRTRKLDVFSPFPASNEPPEVNVKLTDHNGKVIRQYGPNSPLSRWWTRVITEKIDSVDGDVTSVKNLFSKHPVVIGDAQSGAATEQQRPVPPEEVSKILFDLHRRQEKMALGCLPYQPQKRRTPNEMNRQH